MPDAPRKRPWLQFSLTTAVVVMVVTGALLPIILLVVKNWVADAELGGVYLDCVPHCPSAYRGCDLRGPRGSFIGFRVVVEVPKTP